MASLRAHRGMAEGRSERDEADDEDAPTCVVGKALERTGDGRSRWRGRAVPCGRPKGMLVSSPRATPERWRQHRVGDDEEGPPRTAVPAATGPTIDAKCRRFHIGVPDGICQRMANRGEDKAVVEDPGRDRVIVHDGLPRFGTLRRDNTPTPACVCMIYIGSTRLLLELYWRRKRVERLLLGLMSECVCGGVRAWPDVRAA